MYHVYVVDESAFDPKKLVGEYKDIDKAHEKVQNVLVRNQDAKYIIEQTTGHVDSYGELIATVVEEN